MGPSTAGNLLLCNCRKVSLYEKPMGPVGTPRTTAQQAIADPLVERSNQSHLNLRGEVEQ